MKRPSTRKAAPRAIIPARPRKLLLKELRELILQAREGVALAVNSGLVALYWQIGDRIGTEILKQQRAVYGGQIVSALGRQLEKEFGRAYASAPSSNRS